MFKRLRFRWVSQRREMETRGQAGERLAEAYLRGNSGFTLVARNWRNPRDRRDEIDLVMKDGEVLVFVEVKTRSADALVPGFSAVDKRKKNGHAPYDCGLSARDETASAHPPFRCGAGQLARRGGHR